MNYDIHVIDIVFQKIAESKGEEMNLHFIYAGDFYLYQKYLAQLIKMISRRMRRPKFLEKPITLTLIQMWRDKLITKEKMEKYFSGNEKDIKTANDDLESLVKDLQRADFQRERNNIVAAYLIRKLTAEELKLVEQKDSNYMQTFFSNKADVKEDEMKMSESDAKFVLGEFRRQTFTIQSKPNKLFYDFSDIELTANLV